MPGIKITLIVLDKFQVEDLALSSDITAEDLISNVVDRLNLRWVDTDDKPIKYYLERNNDGKVLESGYPFIDLGIGDGDTIALKANGVVIEEDAADIMDSIKPRPDKDGQVTVKLKVLDAHKEAEETFDKHFTVAEILKKIISDYDLPVSDPKTNTPYTYTLASKAIGDFLKDDDTLESAHVPSGDTLTVHRPAEAGAINITDARHSRLQKEFSELMNLSMRGSLRGGLLAIEPVNHKEGCPVEAYIITFTCLGIVGIKDDLKPVYDNIHRIKMTLGAGFPVDPPDLRWLTPIWHPNIMHLEPHTACPNAPGNWYHGGSLADVVIMLGEMVQYKRYHAAWTPPYPADPEVARWVEDYAEPNGIVSKSKPVDKRPLLPRHKIDPQPEEIIEKIAFDQSRISPLSGKPKSGLSANKSSSFSVDSGAIRDSLLSSQKVQQKPSDLAKKVDFDQSKISLLSVKSDSSANPSSAHPAKGESGSLLKRKSIG